MSDSSRRPATKPEPAPTCTDSPAVWPTVIADVGPLPIPSSLRDELARDMRARDSMGREKYGVPLQVQNGRNSAVDAYQEVLDLCAYSTQCRERGMDGWAGIAEDALWLAASIRALLNRQVGGA